MSSAEAVVVRAIARQLDARDIWHINVFGDQHGRRGKPDFIACIDGRFIAIEAKRATNSPSIMQMVHCLEILANGGRFIVAYEDFMLTDVTDHSLPLLEIDRNIAPERLAEIAAKFKGQTYEITTAQQDQYIRHR